MRLIGEQQQVATGGTNAGAQTPPRQHYPEPSRAGFTLIELVIAIVALAALFAGIAAVFITGPAASADPQIRAQARAIAEGYMEEILLKAYRNPEPGINETAGGGVEQEGTPPTPEERAEYDDVWDYCDIGADTDCSGGTESPTNQDGCAMADDNGDCTTGALDDYTVEVVIEGDDPTNLDPDPAKITVIVSHSSGTVNYKLVSERADY